MTASAGGYRAGARLLLLGSVAIGLPGAQGASPRPDASSQAQVAAKPELPTQDGAKQASGVPSASKGAMEGTPTLPANAALPVPLVFQMWNNSVVTVDVLLDGKLQKSVLDTGLSGCAITPARAAELKLTALPAKVTIATLNETRAVPAAMLEKLQMNAVKIGSLRVGLLDVSELYAGVPQPDAPSLWLGTPFLSAFQVTFDYANHVVSLDRPNAAWPKDKGAVIWPIEMRDGQLYTRVTIPHAGSFNALVDTGTMGTVIPALIAAKIKSAPVKTFLVKRVDGKQTKASLITIPKLQVGKMEQEQVPALFLEDSKEDKVGAESGRAVLGNDFLRHYKVTISFARHKMALVLPPAEGSEAETEKKSDTPKAARPSPPVPNGARKGRQ